MSAKTIRARRQRYFRLLLVLALVQFVYVGSYAVLYRRGVAEMNAVGLKGFCYVPIADVIEAQAMPIQHTILTMLYAPINELHARSFGGKSACLCIMFGLSR